MSQHVLLIEKDGNIIEKNIKISLLDKLYSICGYRTDKDFEKLHQLDVYELYGKKSGKKDKQNNYLLPTNDIYYGTLCIIKKNGSISLDEWNIFYMSAMKNFENINSKLELDKEINIVSDTKIDPTLNTDSESESNEQDLILQRHDDELKYEEYEEES